MAGFNKKFNWNTFLTEKYFSFGQAGIPPYTNAWLFKENGEISFGGSKNFNERFWRIDDDCLIIEDQNHQITTKFNLPERFVRGETLVGDFVPDEHVKHELKLVQREAAIEDLINNASNSAKMAIINDLRSELQAPVIKHKHKLIRVAFILNSIETIDAQLILMHALKDDTRFEMKVITLNRIFRDVEKAGSKDQLDEYLREAGFKPVGGDFDDQALVSLKNWQPDFLIRQSEWDADFPKSIAAKRLNWTRLVHIAYVITENLLSNPGDLEKPMFVLDYYEYVWRSFIAEPLTKAEVDLLEDTYISKEKFLAVGSLKALQIRQTTPKWPVDDHGRKKLIWMPHHSIDGWFSFGTFVEVYQGMYEWTKQHPDVSVVFNPHPSLRSVIANPATDFEVAAYDEFVAAWTELPNAEYLINEGSYPAVAASDVVLADGISILFEGQVLNKPIVFLEKPDHVPFTEAGEVIMSGTHRVDGLEAALTMVEHLLVTNDDLAEQQKRNVQNWLVNEHPEYQIIEEMVAELD